MIEVGQKVPAVMLQAVTADGISEVDAAELFAGKKVVMFSLPGAFTSTCSSKHLPSYVREHDQLKSRGVDMIACLSVNDGAVMKAWAEAHSALGKIVMLADGNAELTKALGIELDRSKSYMGLRASRGVMVFDNGVATSVDIETPGTYEVSGADACLRRLG
jgi:glutaredoxin/glutathione-dependent peroxiredoxin